MKSSVTISQFAAGANAAARSKKAQPAAPTPVVPDNCAERNRAARIIRDHGARLVADGSVLQTYTLPEMVLVAGEEKRLECAEALVYLGVPEGLIIDIVSGSGEFGSLRMIADWWAGMTTCMLFRQDPSVLLGSIESLISARILPYECAKLVHGEPDGAMRERVYWRSEHARVLRDIATFAALDEGGATASPAPIMSPETFARVESQLLRLGPTL